MMPLVFTSFTATSCIGRGRAQTLEALRLMRSGLARCAFETVELQTHVGEVAGVDVQQRPAPLKAFDCRNNRLAVLALQQDGFIDAVARSAAKWGRRRVGVFLGTST